ncbi:MAG: hypothetical protein HQM14_08620 [SAR324 cluster bacterium]|nr:hypothetical protein [SAR324 cluster bacterium]
MKTIDFKKFQSIGLLCMLLFAIFLLNGCSGTEIPNGVSSDDDSVANAEDIEQEDVNEAAPVSIAGRVSRTAAVAYQKLYVIDKDSKVIGRVQTDAEGYFVLSSAALGTQWDEKIYPLIIVVPTSPALMTGIPLPSAVASQTVYVNPVTSEALRNTLGAQADLDNFAALLPNTSIVENETGIIVTNAAGQLISTPPLNITSMDSFAESFQSNGDLLVHAAFGQDMLRSEKGNSNFDFFWGTESIVQGVGRQQNGDHLVSTAADEQASDLIDILMLGLDAIGDIETLLQNTLQSSESSGNLLSNRNAASTAFLNQIAAHAVWKSKSTEVFSLITDETVGTVLDATYDHISTVTAVYNSQFLNAESGGLETNVVLDVQTCISNSTASSGIDATINTIFPISLPTQEEEQRIFIQAITATLTMAQQTNAAAFQNAEDSQASENTLTMAAAALTSEVNRVFAAGEINTIFLQPFIATLTTSAGVSIGSISTLGSADFTISPGIQDNITSAVRNVGVYMRNAILRIDAKTALTDAEKQALAFQTSSLIQEVLQDKDISNQNGGIPAADKQQMYCEILNLL